MTQREDYIEEIEAQLEALDVRMNALETRVAQAKSEAKVEYQRQLQALREQRQTVLAQLGKVKESGESAWEHLREGVSNALDELQQGITQATLLK